MALPLSNASTRTCKDLPADNSFTPYMLRNIGVWKKEKKEKKLSSLESGLRIRVTISYHLWKPGEEYVLPSAIISEKKGIVPCNWARFFHTDKNNNNKKRELFGILVSPLMERAEAVKRLVNTHSDSFLSSPSKSSDKGWWSKTTSVFQMKSRTGNCSTNSDCT